MGEPTRDRLLQAAGQIFADRGFQAATVREICQQAEANLAAVNYYFGDKENLYIEAVTQAQCIRAAQVPMPPWPDDMPPQERLREFIRLFLTRLLSGDVPQWHMELMLREMVHPTAACVAVVDAYIRPLAEQLERILRDILPDSISRTDAYLVGFSIVGQCLYFYVHRPIIKLLLGEGYAELNVPRLAEHVARFSLAALGLERPLAPACTAGSE